MYLYETLFVFVFLPIFMGVYKLTPPGIRPWLITAGNLVFIASGGLRGLAVYVVMFAAAYFSGIYIYNSRLDESKRGIRKAVLTANVVLDAAVLVFCSRSSGLTEVGVPQTLRLFGGAVIPLHFISYLTDVYRSSCEAQTSVAVLAAYSSFFPSAGFGPILKYKSFYETFRAPVMTRERLSGGIVSYLTGLTVQLVIVQRLAEIRGVLGTAQQSELTGAAAWVAAGLFYVYFLTAVMAMLMMGRGVGLMLGFPIRPCIRKSFGDDMLKKRLIGTNRQLSGWLHDYIVLPMKKAGVPDAAAGSLAICMGMLWYRFSAGWLAAGTLLAVMCLIQQTFRGRRRPYSVNVAGIVLTKAMLVAAATVCAFSEMLGAGGIGAAFSGSADQDYLGALLGDSAMIAVIGLVAGGTLMPAFLRRLNKTWLRTALPVIELLMLMLCTAYLSSGVQAEMVVL